MTAPAALPSHEVNRRIDFEFDPRKLGQALALLAEGVSDLTKLKAAKLLYFADKSHLLHYGRPIVGDRYYCLDYGPVPTASLNIINDLMSPIDITFKGKKLEHPLRNLVGEFVSVEGAGKLARLKPKKGRESLDALTASERQVLADVVQTYGKKKAGELIDLTHQEHAWKASDAHRTKGSSVEIPWEYFLAEAGDRAGAITEHALARQESRAFLTALHEDLT
jgi:uncharacterized phage-associated protein